MRHKALLLFLTASCLSAANSGPAHEPEGNGVLARAKDQGQKFKQAVFRLSKAGRIAVGSGIGVMIFLLLKNNYSNLLKYRTGQKRTTKWPNITWILLKGWQFGHSVKGYGITGSTIAFQQQQP